MGRSGFIRSIVGALTAVCFCASTALASGIGGSMEYGHSWGDFDGYDYEGDHFAMSFLFDSNVATNQLINYRLQAGFNYADYDDGNEGYGVGIVNTLGFGIYRGYDVRVWAGPSLRVNISSLDVDSSFGGDPEITELAIGLGPQFGVNWHVNDHISLTTTLSYQHHWVGDFCEDDCNGNDFEDGNEGRFSWNVGILFRTPGDIF